MKKNLKSLSYKLRKDVLDIVYYGKAGHIGGDFSVMEILVSLFMKEMNVNPDIQNHPNRDYFIMSKGHSIEAYYSVLAEKGFLDIKDVINNFSKFGSNYIGHPNNKLPGIEMNTGSLGHGLPISVGIAKACKMDKGPNRVYVVMGDGELAEGSVWEGAMAASHYELDNLCAIVDRNYLQISGSTEDVMHHENLLERFTAFGWHVISVNGNDVDALLKAFENARNIKNKPTVVIANTIKGCGVSFMENKAEWHHRVPSEEEYQQAVKELKEKEVTLEHE